VGSSPNASMSFLNLILFICCVCYARMNKIVIEIVFVYYGNIRRMEKHQGITNDSNNVASCMPTSPPVWDLEYIDRLIFVAKSVKQF
jgi:hypothetical protein